MFTALEKFILIDLLVAHSISFILLSVMVFSRQCIFMSHTATSIVQITGDEIKTEHIFVDFILKIHKLLIIALMATHDKGYFVNKRPFRICNKLIFDSISCRLPRNFKTGNGKAKLVFPSYVFYLKTRKRTL